MRGRLKYRVQWLGYDLDLEWYDAWDLVGSPQKLQEFHKDYPDRPGPPKYLDKWFTAWNDPEDRPPKEHTDRNAPVKRP